MIKKDREVARHVGGLVSTKIHEKRLISTMLQFFIYKVYRRLKFVYVLEQCRRKRRAGSCLGHFCLTTPTIRTRERVHMQTRSLRWWQ